MDLLTVIGTVASIFGAFVSSAGAYLAIQAKNEIAKKIHIRDFSKLKSNSEDARKHLRRIVTDENKMRGVNFAEINTSIISLRDSLNDEKAMLAKYGLDSINEIIGSISENALLLREKRSEINIKDVGNSLYELNNLVLSKIGEITRKQIEGN